MKTGCATRSWREYNKSLVDRGNISMWIGSDVAKRWKSCRQPGILGGRKEKFSDDAILSLMLLKTIFRMPYRMLEGFARSLLVAMGLPLPVPHFTRICKRSKKLELPQIPRGKKITDIVIDSSGVKIYGEGEWKVEQHGRERKKKWKKVHIAIDPETQEVIFTDVTDKDTHDSTVLPKFLNQVPGKVGRVFGDGAYDTRACYEAIVKKGGEPVIPPRKTAKTWKSSRKWAKWRNQAVLERRGLGLDDIGIRLWKKIRRFGIRSLVETFFSRFKTAFGDRTYSRGDQGILIEIGLKCLLLNAFARLGLLKRVPA